MGVSDRKVTLNLPEGLLEDAQEITSTGVTDTIRRALEILVARKSYNDLLRLRGTIDLKLDISELRKDR